MSDALDNIRKGEPGRSEKAAAWQSAIGMQAADGLSTSDFLQQISQKHINGKISLEEAQQQLNRYYFEKNAHDAADPEKEDADKVSLNIAEILLSETFEFSAEGLISLQNRIFDGVYENAGELRTASVSIKEWVLGGDSASFTDPESIPASLEQIIAREKSYRYEEASSDALISHLAAFVSEVWHLCPFGGGNTRFTAVFTRLYLSYLGIDYNNDIFANYSWYFHNALVRANYRDIVKNIDAEPVYLERFFRNMLLGEQWDLRNRYLHIRPAAVWSVQSNLNTNKSTGQVRVKKEVRKEQEIDKKPISKSEVTTVNDADNPNLVFLAVVLGERFLSVKEIMDGLHLKGRDNFLKLYLTPAVNSGIVAQLYPNAPRHPRQKYLLTRKGFDFLREIGPEMTARVERHLAALRA